MKTNVTTLANEFHMVRRIAASPDIPINLRYVQQYSAYLRGAYKAIERMSELFPELFKGKNGAYNKAIVTLATSSLRNTDLFLMGECEIRFRNHINDRKGKCTECEAYFSETITINKEVK